MSDTVEDFNTLFRGRCDAYGSWSGGMVPKTDYTDSYYEHLHDGPFIGVYPVTDDNTVGWGCIDLDGKDFLGDWTLMWKLAAELQDVLAYKDVTSWLERTEHGIHVWVFSEARVPAATMRRALLVACEVADYRAKEVNPKSEFVSPEKPFSNYVRLPFYGALAHGTPVDRFVVDEDGRPMTVEAFCRAAMGSRVPVETLQSMSTMYAPPVARHSTVELDQATEDEFVNLRPILPPVVKMMFEDGPKGDRSAALVRACVILRDDGWKAQAVFTVLRALDRLVLLKFADRPDPDGPLLKILETCGVQ